VHCYFQDEPSAWAWLAEMSKAAFSLRQGKYRGFGGKQSARLFGLPKRLKAPPASPHRKQSLAQRASHAREARVEITGPGINMNAPLHLAVDHLIRKLCQPRAFFLDVLKRPATVHRNLTT
jgi:hypothetical protein